MDYGSGRFGAAGLSTTSPCQNSAWPRKLTFPGIPQSGDGQGIQELPEFPSSKGRLKRIRT